MSRVRTGLMADITVDQLVGHAALIRESATGLRQQAQALLESAARMEEQASALEASARYAEEHAVTAATVVSMPAVPGAETRPDAGGGRVSDSGTRLGVPVAPAAPSRGSGRERGRSGTLHGTMHFPVPPGAGASKDRK